MSSERRFSRIASFEPDPRTTEARVYGVFRRSLKYARCDLFGPYELATLGRARARLLGGIHDEAGHTQEALEKVKKVDNLFDLDALRALARKALGNRGPRR